MNTNISFQDNKLLLNEDYLTTMGDVIRSFSPNITETKKYGMPCFYYKGKAFCYLWTSKINNGACFLIVEGRNIQHRHLKIRNHSRMKVFNVTPSLSLANSDIRSILNAALGRIQIK